MQFRNIPVPVSKSLDSWRHEGNISIPIPALQTVIPGAKIIPYPVHLSNIPGLSSNTEDDIPTTCFFAVNKKKRKKENSIPIPVLQNVIPDAKIFPFKHISNIPVLFRNTGDILIPIPALQNHSRR